MALKVSNNATTTLAIGISSSATSATLTDGSVFPALGGGDWFWGTFVDASNNIEVVKVTARSSNVVTITRAQDGTTAKAYLVGDRFDLRPTAALFNDKADKDNPSFTTGITTPAITLGSTALTPTGTELNYVAGVTSAIQTQINTKAPTASPTFTGTISGDAASLSSTLGVTGSATLSSTLGVAGASTFSGNVVMSSAPVLFAGVSVAADPTAMNIWTANYINVTGTAITITAFPNAPQAGCETELYMNAAHTFVNSANLLMPGSLNYTATVGDRIRVRALSTNVFAVEIFFKMLQPIGLGQTYQDVTASRAFGVTYTNSSGRAILVSMWAGPSGTAVFQLSGYIGGVLIYDRATYANGPGANCWDGLHLVVPPGATYKVTNVTCSLIKWFELR